MKGDGEMPGNYRVLPIAPVVFRTLAWISILLGLISALIIFTGATVPESPRWMGFVSLVLGVLYGFVFLVVGEAVELLLDINSRV